jgi:TolB protein
MNIKGIRVFCLFLIVAWAGSAPAVLKIEITQGEASGIPVAIVPFGLIGANAPPHDIGQVVTADLDRSGEFASIPSANFLSFPHRAEQVRYKDWRVAKAEALVIGEIADLGDGTYRVEARAYDVFREKMIIGRKFDRVPGHLLRKVAHQISDYVYEAMTGRPGAFDTQIAYVTSERLGGGKPNHYLQIADSDGFGPKTIFQSDEPLLSPAWSPDSSKLAYVSFEQKRSIIVIHDLNNGERNVIAAFAGINGAPAWSPDGGRLAFASSEAGGADIYTINIASREKRRLTRHYAIDTEPAWSPDGESLVFTSDRSGRPHIYRIGWDGSDLQRVTFEGKYNARASFSPDGRSLVMVTVLDSDYRIATYDIETGAQTILTSSQLDESPSFAPNGAMILYATQKGFNGILSAVSSDGRIRQELKFQNGDVREPAWSPFGRKF